MQTRAETVKPPKIIRQCGYCPHVTNNLTGGEYYNSIWFCSHQCVENYKEDEREELRNA